MIRFKFAFLENDGIKLLSDVSLINIFIRRSNYVRRFGRIGGNGRTCRGGGSKHPVSKEKSAGFTALENLKEGEALRLKVRGNFKFPKMGETLYVYRVLENPLVDGLDSGHQVQRHDFTVLLEDEDGDINEFSFDSRYFERITA